MRLFLVVQNEGKQKGMKIPASVLPFFIGRDPECHLRPASPIISKKHCGFFLEDAQFFLEDFGSTNGTILRGERLSGKSMIASGDRVIVGPLEFDVLIESKVEAPTQSAAPVVSAPIAPKPAAVAPKPVAPAATPAASPAKPAAPAAAKPAPTSAKPPAPAAAPAASPAKPAAPAAAKPAPAPIAPAAKAAPAPKPAPAPAEDANAFDDDIAALLLGGDGAGSGDMSAEGTTVIDLMNADSTPTPPAGTPINPADTKAPAARPPVANTTDAAKALLEKYMRRPRAT